MSKKIIYTTVISLGLNLCLGIGIAQSGNEFKFYALKGPAGNDTSLVKVSSKVDTRQSVSDNGIHFTLIVKNNSGKAIAVKNIADMLVISLKDSLGLDVAIPNINIFMDDKRYDTTWRFRSKAVIPDKSYINGRIENSDLKNQEYIEILGDGSYSIDLFIKDVLKVRTLNNADDNSPRATVSVAPGKYKLGMLIIVGVKTGMNKPVSHGILFQSPVININYSY